MWARRVTSTHNYLAQKWSRGNFHSALDKERQWKLHPQSNQQARNSPAHVVSWYFVYVNLSHNYSCAKICIFNALNWTSNFPSTDPPEFNQGNTSEKIIPGQNMTLDCSADGNPKPETHWNYTSAENLHVATVGRHKIMTITRATSTNAGKYVCVASNKLGMETRFVLLTEIGMYADCLSDETL